MKDNTALGQDGSDTMLKNNAAYRIKAATQQLVEYSELKHCYRYIAGGRIVQ